MSCKPASSASEQVAVHSAEFLSALGLHLTSHAAAFAVAATSLDTVVHPRTCISAATPPSVREQLRQYSEAMRDGGSRQVRLHASSQWDAEGASMHATSRRIPRHTDLLGWPNISFAVILMLSLLMVMEIQQVADFGRPKRD